LLTGRVPPVATGAGVGAGCAAGRWAGAVVPPGRGAGVGWAPGRCASTETDANTKNRIAGKKLYFFIDLAIKAPV